MSIPNPLSTIGKPYIFHRADLVNTEIIITATFKPLIFSLDSVGTYEGAFSVITIYQFQVMPSTDYSRPAVLFQTPLPSHQPYTLSPTTMLQPCTHFTRIITISFLPFLKSLPSVLTYGGECHLPDQIYFCPNVIDRQSVLYIIINHITADRTTSLPRQQPSIKHQP